MYFNFFLDIPLEENKKFIEIEKLTGKVKTTKIIDREEWNGTSYFMVIYISYYIWVFNSKRLYNIIF